MTSTRPSLPNVAVMSIEALAVASAECQRARTMLGSWGCERSKRNARASYLEGDCPQLSA